MTNPDADRASAPRVWLITGASSGFGRAIASAALASGDIVVATARRPWMTWSPVTVDRRQRTCAVTRTVR